MKHAGWKIGVLGLGAWLCVAPATSVAQVVIRTAPPMVRAAPPPPIRPGFVWDPAHVEWRNGRYVQVSGHYIPERRGFVWVPGRWVVAGGGYRWFPGEWRPRR